MAEKRIFDIETEATIDDITQKVYAWFDKKAQQGEVQEPSWKFDVYLLVKILNNFATKFVPNVATVEGKCYWHNGELYMCNVAYTGDWVPGNFTRTSVDELLMSDTAATEADLVADSKLPIMTANGPKSLPGNTIAKASEQTSLTTYAQNVAASFAPSFDPTRDSEHAYPAGYSVTYTDGKVYTFKVPHYGQWNSADVFEVVISENFVCNNVLRGKKWYACGDSYTAGLQASSGVITDEGLYKGFRAVYPYYIGNRTGMDVRNIAVGGMTLAYKAEYSDVDNCFSLSDTGLYLSIPSDADYITLKFGINDYYQSIPVGTIDDNDNTTLYGAWNVVMSRIRSNCPRAKIGIIVTNRAPWRYSKAGRDIAIKWGVPYLDENFDYNVPLLNDVTGKPDVLDSVKDAVNAEFRISSSNIHPNDFAHLYESTIVENFLKSL